MYRDKEVDLQAGAAGHGFESHCGQELFILQFRVFRALGSSTDPIQMKSGAMKDNLRNGGVVQRRFKLVRTSLN